MCGADVWPCVAFPLLQGLIPACAGQTAGRVRVGSLNAGSSPRVRGRLAGHVGDAVRWGLIPACAGQTVRVFWCPLLAGAHPRVCGADYTRGLITAESKGSSPRVRGRRLHELVGVLHAGLIPACAGQTAAAGAWRCPHGAHPRVCGADCRSEAAGRAPAGLIPACAGQTRMSRSCRRSTRAHPRVCGADFQDHNRPWISAGSSPRVRGRLWTTRITRMCARAHPRVCGADRHGTQHRCRNDGSSPRVRGRLAPVGGEPSGPGLIPACAGQTGHVAVFGAAARAHPRVCGADVMCLPWLIRTMGSSPRVRGRPHASASCSGSRGLIPACAGQTHF